ncbi:sugar phosphate nucleotidyltransferase [Thermogladius sp. 4427co]|uniref:sugar phosphate nucleotidyltransferase n=1 Tax=Thermogladius sp. 4427co TaxID=3450718 RepID=UPI003F7AD24F
MVKTVIMAGGEGVRLRPLTVTRPKPMIPVANIPMITRLIEHVKSTTGILDIGVTLYYLPNVIMSHLRDGSELGVRIYYSIEEKPLGTAGGVKKMIDDYAWDDTIIVVSGDVLTNIDLGEVLKFHYENNSDFTIVVRREKDVTRFGIVELDSRLRVTRFKEKPSPSEVFSDLINTGIYVIEPHVFKAVGSRKNMDFANDLIPFLIQNNYRLYGFVADKYYWSDIGDIEQYRATHIDVLSGSLNLPGGIREEPKAKGVFIGRNASVKTDRIIPPVIIGEGSKVISSVIGPYTVIGRNVIVEEDSVIENSIVFDNVYIGSSVRVEGAIIGEKATIGDHTVIGEGAVIGDESRIGRGSQVKPRVKIWPSKIIDPYTTVSSDVKWGIRWSRVLFEPWGLSGVFNIDITPELLVKLGLTIGSILRERSTVLIGHDLSMTSLAAARAVEAGILASGVDVKYLGAIPLPLLTYSIKKLKTPLGVYVNSVQGDHMRLRLKFFEEDGKFLTKNMSRKIEEIFFREQIRRSADVELGHLTIEPGLEKDYVEELFNYLPIEASRMRNLRILVDCAGGVVSRIVPEVFSRMDISVYYSNCTDMKVPRHLRKNVYANIYTSTANIIRDSGFDLGFIFDNDGDKLALATRRSGVVSGDRLVALMAAIMLKKHPGGRILLPSTMSQGLIKFVEDLGGKVELGGTGLMGLSDQLDDKYIMAADERGSIIFPFLHFGPDAIFTALSILDYAVSNDIDETISSIPEFFKLRKELYLPYEKRALFARKLVENVELEIVELGDGFKIFFAETGWAYLRFMRSEPVVEIVVESSTKESAEVILKNMLYLVNSIIEKLE